MGFSFLRQIIPQKFINLVWHLPQAVLANVVYGFPSRKLTVIGITGTSGKTTTTHLIYHLLKTAGFKVALVSSVAAKIGDKRVDIGLHVTNPEPWLLQKLLKKIADQGLTHVVLEVTSHGLDQHRTWGINFAYGLIINLRHEHLDYHQTITSYHAAKLKLVKAAKVAVLNSADQSYAAAKKIARGQVLSFKPQTKLAAANLLGDFNQENIAAAAAVAQDLGVKAAAVNQALKSFPGIPGRMELVYQKDFTVVVDFAHKPDALERALQAIKALKGGSGRTIAVFGCAGLRDRLKRPQMGEIAAKLADVTILTAEDPRTEDVNTIITAIAQGALAAGAKEVSLKAGYPKKAAHVFIRQPDRQAAINLAVHIAKPGDWVGLFGKSHEKSMCFGTIEYAWDEFAAVKKALKKRQP